MKFTFPHMGNMYIPAKGLLEYLDLDVIVPPFSSHNTLQLGLKVSPEFACIPLKINLGNLIEAWEKGANTAIMAGGVGPCRFGLYAEVEREILKDLGYDYEFLVFEPPDRHFLQFISRIRKVVGSASWFKVIEAIKFSFRKACACDTIERKVQSIRPLEKKQGMADKVYKKYLKEIDNAQSFISLDKTVENGLIELEEINLQEHPDILKVGLVGEIYTILEPFVNLDIEKELGKLGVTVTRSLYLSEWINSHLLMNLSKEINLKPFPELAKPYLNYFVGGHGRETVGYTVGFAQEGYDGIIQIAPLTCMPEIVAHSVMSSVKKDHDIPIISIYLDEHSGKAGLVTRLEAFIDLIRRRKCDKKEVVKCITI